MKKKNGRLIPVLTVAVIGLTLAPPATAQQPADDVIRITKEMWAAGRQRDLAGATKYIANDYTEFNAAAATRLEGKDLSVRLTEAGFQDAATFLVDEMLNPKVQVYGNVAILSYNYFGVSQDKDGVNQNFRAKSTRVYVRQGSTWMLVHANFAADPQPTP